MSEPKYERYTTETGRASQKLEADKAHGWLLGVCAGVANHFGLDHALVRVITVIVAMFMPKTIIAAYLIGWLVLDDRVLPKNKR